MGWGEPKGPTAEERRLDAIERREDREAEHGTAADIERRNAEGDLLRDPNKLPLPKPDPVAATPSDVADAELVVEFINQAHRELAASAIGYFALAQRANDHTDTGLRGTDPDPSTRGGTRKPVPLLDGTEVPDTPPRSDPTGEKALRPPAADYTAAIAGLAAVIRAQGDEFLTLLRAKKANRIERASTDRLEDVADTTKRIKGFCDACGEFDEKLSPKDGYRLDKSHREGARRAGLRDPPITTAQFVANFRRTKGLPPIKRRSIHQ